MWIFIAILEFLILLIAIFIIRNLTIKETTITTWIENFIKKIISVNQRITEIDEGGAFEADDMVGDIFKQIRDIIRELNLLIENPNENKGGDGGKKK